MVCRKRDDKRGYTSRHPKGTNDMAKGQKVDKRYILSDSTVNCYGFRLLTSGYQLADYSRNPIGYYMHNRTEGVVVRWEDIQVEGDTVTGVPVINLANARGQQTLDEVESGFLNAASVGDIIVLEYSMEPEMMLAGQTGPTITKWTHKECSLVDVPGNGNALCLFDSQDNPLTLANLTYSSIPQLTLKSDSDMKKISLNLTSGLLASLKFAATDEVKEGAIEAAVHDLANRAARADVLEVEATQLKAEKTALETQLTALKAAGVAKDVETILAAAQVEKGLTNETKTQLAAAFATNPEGLKSLVATLSKHQSVVDLMNKGGQGKAEDLSTKTWDELHKSNKLESLKASNPDAYKTLYREKFGKDPKVK